MWSQKAFSTSCSLIVGAPDTSFSPSYSVFGVVFGYRML